MDIGRGEHNPAQSALKINCCMELESEMPALPVLAEFRDIFAGFMAVRTYQPTHLGKGGIYNLYGSTLNEKTVERREQKGKNTMAVFQEAVVFG
jgi:hypothetical protein